MLKEEEKEKIASSVNEGFTSGVITNNEGRPNTYWEIKTEKLPLIHQMEIPEGNICLNKNVKEEQPEEEGNICLNKNVKLNSKRKLYYKCDWCGTAFRTDDKNELLCDVCSSKKRTAELEEQYDNSYGKW